MIQLRRGKTREDPIDWAGLSVTVVSSETAVWAGTRSFGIGFSYLRPARVEVSGDRDARLFLLDHLMLARIAMFLLTAVAIRRRLR